MKIEIRADHVIIEGYVNAVGRDSRVLPSARGRFIEQVTPKTFEKALSKTDNVEVRFNHIKVIGSTKQGNLQLHEDSIGLYAKATISDQVVVEKAKNRELRGWSFAFVTTPPNGDKWEEGKDGIQRRYLEDIELREVSILDKTPAYIATSIEVRGEESFIVEERNFEDIAETTVIEEQRTEQISYDLYEKQIQILKLRGENV